jgi:hypothetical protein
MPDIIQQLKDMKQSQVAGAVDDVQAKHARAELLQAIGGQQSAPLFVDYISYYREAFGKAISVPVTVMASLVILIFGGGMTTVNAAYDSLPGDTLYTVKILTERAQLQFASGERRAVLHTEFAHRRLQEAVELTDDPARSDDAEDAMDAFRAQLAAANTELQQLQEEGDEETLLAAANVDQALGELEAAFEEADAGASDVANTVMDVTRETSQVVETVSVETHEADPQEESEQSLARLFKNRLSEVRDREAFNYGRVVMLTRVIDPELVDSDKLLQLNYYIESTAERVHDATSLAASGGYGAAFDILREVDQALIDIEAQIVEIEGLIIAAQQPVVEEGSSGLGVEEAENQEKEGVDGEEVRGASESS